jgi:NADH-quinone oxidoreductase subunit E
MEKGGLKICGDKLQQILGHHAYEQDRLIGILQDTQRVLGYLPMEAIELVAETLDVPVSRILSIATFYKSFSLTPKGQHVIKICKGTACHVRGSSRIMEKLSGELGITAGETTPDYRFTLETVRCIGCCGLAPVMQVDEKVFGRLSQSRVGPILRSYVED